MRIRFRVSSGRYPSLLDVMRDRYGIKGRRSATTTFFASLRTKHSSDYSRGIGGVPLVVEGPVREVAGLLIHSPTVRSG